MDMVMNDKDQKEKLSNANESEGISKLRMDAGKSNKLVNTV